MRTYVHRFQESDRPELVAMLERSGARSSLTDLYRRARWNDNIMLIARTSTELVGMLAGVILSGLDEDTFEPLRLPAGRHACLLDIHVDSEARERGIGTLLVSEFVEEARRRGCTFMAGSLDQTSDDRVRRAFFDHCGFTVHRMVFGTLL